MEQNEQKFTSKQAEIIGNFALYSGIVGQQTVTVSTHDLSLLVAMALRAEPAEGSLKASQDILADKETLIGELKKDVKAAEAHSEKLDEARKHESKERGKALGAAVFWRDAIGDIHKALGGNDAVDVDGLADNEFVERLVDVVKSRSAALNGYRDEANKITRESHALNWRSAYFELLKTVGLSFVDVDTTHDCHKVIKQARKLYQMEGRRDGTVSASLMKVYDHAFSDGATIDTVKGMVQAEVSAMLPEVI